MHTPGQSFPAPCHHTAHPLHCCYSDCTETAPLAAGSLAGTGLLSQGSAQNEQTASSQASSQDVIPFQDLIPGLPFPGLTVHWGE